MRSIHPATFLLFCCVVAPAVGQPPSGARFVVSFMHGHPSETPVPKLIASSDVDANGTITQPQTGLVILFAVPAGGSVVIALPASIVPSASDAVENKALLVEADAPIALQALFDQYASGDATAVLPMESSGPRFRVVAYRGYGGNPDLPSQVVVASGADGTAVIITPTVNTAGGHLAGVPYTVVLDAGQCYQVKAAHDTLDLTGSLIEVVGTTPCHGVAVFGGSRCAEVPIGPPSCMACDQLYEQIPPVTHWGLTYATVPFSSASGHTWRALADEDSTWVEVDGVGEWLQAGQFINREHDTVARIVSANKPICVAQYMEGRDCAGNGDPSLLLLEPLTDGLTSAVFHGELFETDAVFRAGLSTSAANVGQVLLDGAPIGLGAFVPFATDPNMVFADIAVAPGPHVLSAPLPFRAHLYGMAFFSSIAARIGNGTPIAAVHDTVICHAGGPITLLAPATFGAPYWTSANDATDTLATGNTLTLQAWTDTMVVAWDTSALACPPHARYTLELPLVDNVFLNSSEPAICAHHSVLLSASGPAVSAFSIAWSPSGSVVDPTADSTLAYPLDSTWFHATFSSTNGCWTGHDSLFVPVQPNTLVHAELGLEAAAICENMPVQAHASAFAAAAFDAFDGPLSPWWDTVDGGLVDVPCAPLAGTALVFQGQGVRGATTDPFDLSGAAELRFALIVGNGLNGCDDADPLDSVRVECSTDGGATWELIDALDPEAFGMWRWMQLVLPQSALSTGTHFRWRQDGMHAAGEDAWAVDNVVVLTQTTAGLQFDWQPAAWASDPAASDPLLLATTPGTVVLTIADTLGGCAITDSANVVPGTPITVQLPADTAICGPQNIAFLASASTAPLQYAWSTNIGQLLAAQDSAATFHLVDDCTITAQVVNADGCAAADGMDVLVLFTPDDFTLAQVEDSVCGGPVGPYIYQWYLDSVAVPGADTQCTGVLTAGWYELEVTASTGCAVSGAGYYLPWDPNSIAEAPTAIVQAFDGLSFTPSSALTGLRCYDAIGRLVAEKKERIAAGQRVELPPSAAGLYLLEAFTERRKYVLRAPVFER